ncbi:MAG: GDP-mannose 4,6-dehydratase, partial [Bacteroidales bacterium]|nr:GDP-mannose 4,6-dehydratase [Bacteroidales bacterium]
MKKIIITGATGMIGSALVGQALEKVIEILCIVRKDSRRMDNIPKSEKVKLIFADLSEYASLNISG